jgi:hypothetical protein
LLLLKNFYDVTVVQLDFGNLIALSHLSARKIDLFYPIGHLCLRGDACRRGNIGAAFRASHSVSRTVIASPSITEINSKAD